VRWLGVSQRLAWTLTSTNAVESMISVARTTTRNVKRWKDGEMVAAGPQPGCSMLSAASVGSRAAKTCPRWPVTPRR
jgi:hypothetical protein